MLNTTNRITNATAAELVEIGNALRDRLFSLSEKAMGDDIGGSEAGSLYQAASMADECQSAIRQAITYKEEFEGRNNAIF